MARLTLRAALPADAETVYRMIRDLCTALGEGELFEARLEDVQRDAFGPDRRYETWLAELDERPVGLLSFYMTYSTYKGAPCLFIDNLFVEPWARGERAGAKLMAAAARLAIERGCCRIDLHVLKSNPARSFYDAIGLMATDERPYSIDRVGLRKLAAEI
ncbi:MAG TPA: GNAT family N-acetyltransferase [Kiloniellaceae bacterium]|nr:GNAT family N-acetyltransferase [Kiloniellaceae bacterium]